MSINRREFITLVAGTVALAANAHAQETPRPNILWITSEDNGPQLGCYGDAYAQTPNLDQFAKRSLRYLHAWSNAPVCAPARTCLVTGVYPPSTGAEHMRSAVRLPAHMQLYPEMLREAGYYCTNNSKTDYNLTRQTEPWDESSGKAHYRNRKPGQPFFAVFNITTTHESQIRKRNSTLQHDPAKARVPAYHPDTPEVRRDWAQYYDNMTAMDATAGRHLRDLEEAGLAEDTIVFYYGDHGSGMPRSKRTPCNSGLHVPLLVHIPEKFKHLAPRDYKEGGTTDRLVSFADLAPTLLSLLGVKPPEWLQGSAFMGKFDASPREYVYGFRGRMDERYDLVRSVRDKRYVYVRNYMPHRPHGQHVSYQFETASTQVWRKLYDEGKLSPPKTYFWEPRPPEELYDLQNDPDEVNNLANSAEHQEILLRLRKAEQAWVTGIRDVGFLPEGEIHSRSQGSTAYEMGHDDAKYPFQRVLAMANVASFLKPEALPQLKQGLTDSDSAVRYWAAMGILMRGKAAVDASISELHRALAQDQSPYVRVVAAEALGRFREGADVEAGVNALVDLADARRHGVFAAIFALNSLDLLDERAAGAKAEIQALPKNAGGGTPRIGEYIPRLLEKTLADLG